MRIHLFTMIWAEYMGAAYIRISTDVRSKSADALQFVLQNFRKRLLYEYLFSGIDFEGKNPVQRVSQVFYLYFHMHPKLFETQFEI